MPVSEPSLIARFVVKKVVSGFHLAIEKSPLIDFPVPPYDLMRRTGPKSVWQYYHGGLRSICRLPFLRNMKAFASGVP